MNFISAVRQDYEDKRKKYGEPSGYDVPHSVQPRFKAAAMETDDREQSPPPQIFTQQRLTLEDRAEQLI